MRRFSTPLAALLCWLPAAAAPRVAILADPGLDGAARYGLARLEKALEAKAARPDLLVVAGLRTGRAAADALRQRNISLPESPEALVIRKTEVDGKPALILCGADARGLMYAALEAAERVSWSSDPRRPFSQVRDVAEQPYIGERAVSIYTMHRAYFESRLYDEAHWQRYFDLLASSRINRFVIIFGYENGGFLAPVYPYFFDLKEFPDVKLAGLTPEQQKRNVAAFRAMIRAAHERGIAFAAGIWDHIYRGGVQGGGIQGASELAGTQTPGLVWGVTADNLAAYNMAALRRFLEVFPEIDALQFRMHDESGLRPSEMESFWHEVFAMIRRARPDLPVDIRAKGLPDSIIADGRSQGVKLRVTTKYWMEQMGLPFHPTHVNRQNQRERRHGYADLLRYPQQYTVVWRLWNGGTTRLLLWADPGYVRRFAASARLYQGDSFEVNEMLATKMLGEPHDAAPVEILNPRYRYYDYEFERYWHFYQLWGRLGYNPATPAETWEREFERRFGKQAGPELMSGLHLASRVLPRIVAASYPYSFFPTTRGWPEMMRLNDLPQYAAEHSTDTEQFQNARARARNILEGANSASRWPEDTSRWFARLSDQILGHLARAEKTSGDHRSKEFLSTVTDLKILARLAQYHSHRMRAAVDYSLFQQSGDLFSLDDAVRGEKEAVAAWERLVEAAGDVYSENLPFGVHRVGFSRHWKEELEKLRRGLDLLEKERAQARLAPAGSSPRIAHAPVRRAEPRDSVAVRATVAAEGGVRQAQVLVAEGAGDFKPAPMREAGPGRYQADISRAAEGELRYLIEVIDAAGRRAMLPPQGKTEPFLVTITSDRQPPEVRLDPPAAAQPGEALRVTARVRDPSGVRTVRLHYRHLSQFEDYQTLDMARQRESELFEAKIPGDFIVPQWDLMYFIAALDNKGNGRLYPDLETETPYIVVPLRR